jgi:LPPG:FO 2-phospho-L-lactate transferase
VREALRDAPAPVVAVSPLVRGEVLKGPTEVFLEWAGYALDADGIAVGYDGVIDGLVADQRTDRLPVLETDVLMADADGRRRVAEAALGFAEALR